MALSRRTAERLIAAAERAARELRFAVRSCSKQEVRESYPGLPRAAGNADRAAAAARRELDRPAPAKPRRAPVRSRPRRQTYFVARVVQPGTNFYSYSLMLPDGRLVRGTYDSQAAAQAAIEALGGFVGTHPHHGVIVVNTISPPADPATVDALRRLRAARSIPTAQPETRP